MDLDTDPLFSSSWSSLSYTPLDVSTYKSSPESVTNNITSTTYFCLNCYPSSLHIATTAIMITILLAGFVLNTSLLIYLIKVKLNNMFLVGLERVIILSEVLLSLTFLPVIVSVTMTTNLFPSLTVSQMYVSMWICILLLTLSLSLVSSIVAILECHSWYVHQTSLTISVGTTIALALAFGLTVWILDLDVSCKHGFCWPEPQITSSSQVWGYSFTGLALILAVVISSVSFIGIALSTYLIKRKYAYTTANNSFQTVPATEGTNMDVRIEVENNTCGPVVLHFLKKYQLSSYQVLVMLSVFLKAPLISILGLNSVTMIQLRRDLMSHMFIASLTLLLIETTLLRPTFYMIFIKPYRKVFWCYNCRK